MAKKVFILSDAMGSDPELGRILMTNFLYSLARNPVKPAAVMLGNRGVLLACEGSESIDDLRMLADAGVMVGSCGTCLEHLQVADKLVVGGVSTMTQGVAALMGDGEVVTIA